MESKIFRWRSFLVVHTHTMPARLRVCGHQFFSPCESSSFGGAGHQQQKKNTWYMHMAGSSRMLGSHDWKMAKVNA